MLLLNGLQMLMLLLLLGLLQSGLLLRLLQQLLRPISQMHLPLLMHST